MPQGVLNFILEGSDERITPSSGLVIFGEYLKAIGLDRLFARHFPVPLSHRGYEGYRYVLPLVLMLHGGGRYLEDLRRIERDETLRELLGICQVPKADSVGKWLVRQGLQGIYALKHIEKKLLTRHLRGIEPLILDIDATFMKAHKWIAEYTYKGFPGFGAMLGHINGGWVLHSELRSGNIAPADHNLSFVKHCRAQLPEGRRLDYLRADAASYQHELFDYCEEEGITYTIGARLDSRVLEAIEGIKEWEPFASREGQSHRVEEEVAEVWHTLEEGAYAFRLVVIRKRTTPLLPHIWETLSEVERLALSQERYQVIATNADKEKMSAAQVVRFYRLRSDRSENRIKELKNGFNLSYLPTSNFMANAFYFQIGILAYNLFLLFKQSFDPHWRRHTIQTIRYKLYQIAGKLIHHARQTILRVPHVYYPLLQRLRERSLQIARE